jgi:Tol biopolymer transport system component
LALAVALCAITRGVRAGQTIRISVSSAGDQSNSQATKHTAISGDGMRTAFASTASNLVPGDTNGATDIFVRDCAAGTTTRVSVATDGSQANGVSDFPAFSTDGRCVAFESAANDLVVGDTNGKTDIFVRDLVTHVTTRASVASNGDQADDDSYRPALSQDGRYVVFASLGGNLVPDDTNATCDIFVHDRQTQQTQRVSIASDGQQADQYCWRPQISGGGRFAAFESRATTLVTDDTNGAMDIFVHDRDTGQTQRVNIGPGGSQAASDSSACSISADGRYVAFESAAGNLVPDDTNGYSDVFVHDRDTGITARVSVRSDGQEAHGASWGSSISADGRFVAFDGPVSDLVPDDTNGVRDVFVHDRHTAATTRVSVTSSGQQADGHSLWPHLSADGRFVVFASEATDLVPDDTNGPGEPGRDAFHHDRAGDLAGDLDADNDVDLDDLALLVQALTGPNSPTDQFAADLDGDGDCDVDDFGRLAAAFSDPM